MNVEKVLGLLASEFEKEQIDFALVGGLALTVAGAERATYDIDFMILLAESKKIDKIMKRFGYEPLLRTENIANYSGLGEFGQVDFLFAHRTYSLRMLKNAKFHTVLGRQIKVVEPEDIIGLKVQSSANDPKRFDQDMLDIKNILRTNTRKLDLNLVREYFKLFNRENELDNILNDL